MAGSQLKKLKADLHTKRTSGNPKSKAAAQQSKAQQAFSAKGSQFQDGRKSRPKSDAKARADNIRRSTLLPALQNRHKVGGIVDRRIGENDPTMSPEERMLQRYAKQRSRRDTFNLEEGDDDDAVLTHGGRSLFDLPADDFQEDLSDGADDEPLLRETKRRRSDEGADEDEVPEQPERKKSKKEVMEEIIAKSKLYKYERQKAKDEDDDIREELDKGMGDLLAVLRGGPTRAPPPAPVAEPKRPVGIFMNPDRAAFHNGGPPEVSEAVEKEAEPVEKEAAPEARNPSPIAEPTPPVKPPLSRREKAERDYDLRLRQMAMDQKAQPTERTKTVEEKAEAEAKRLEELESRRLRRMRGEQEESESEVEAEQSYAPDDEDEDLQVNEAEAFGLGGVVQSKKKAYEVEDEDDFVIDEDLVASGSDIDEDFSEGSEASEEVEDIEDDDAEFLKDVLPNGGKPTQDEVASKTSQLPYTYPCPQSHKELLQVLKDVPVSELPLVIQRIRALYHPQLNAANKEKLSHFACSLIDHLSYLGSQNPSLPIVEQLIRHIHSLSKTYPKVTANTFRSHLSRMHEENSMTSGDLCILTAIGTIFPTSDHFHQVVTPAITLMGRWLGLTIPRTEEHLRTGAYIVALALKYQQLSKRYIPEAVRFTTTAISSSPQHQLTTSHITNLLKMADMWPSKSAFLEMFYPAAFKALKKTGDKRAIHHLRIALTQSILRRRPLELHHHKPLAIPSRVPRFEENFHPDRHYDPDADRAESNRLRKEHKRERKGAVRELRKDADFVAREKFREKKERDAEYEKKQRRLIAEIQSGEGREANEYEREKRKRKGQK